MTSRTETSIERLLGKSTDILMKTLDNLKDGVFVLDVNWNFTYLNQQAADIAGLKPKDIVGRNLWKDFPQVKGTALEENYLEAMKSQEIRNFEANGSGTAVFDITVYPSQEGIVVTWQDITIRKKAEEALRESEERFFKVFNNSPVAIAVTSPDHKYVDVNQSWLTLFEFSREEVIGHTPTDLNMFPTNYPQVKSIVNATITQGGTKSNEVQAYTKTGQLLIVQASTQIIDVKGKQYILSSTLDLTKRKKAEQALSKAKTQYEFLFNSVKEGFANYKAILDENGKLHDLLVLKINPAGAEQSGVSPESQINRTWRQIWRGIPEEVFSIYRQVYETGKSHSFEHYSPITNRWYRISINRIAKEQFAVTFFDITERKKAEENLIENEQRYRSLFSNMVDGFAYCQMLFDSAGKPVDLVYLEVNEAFERLTGLKRENVVGRKITEVVPGTRESNPEILDIYGRVSQTGKPERFEVFFKPFRVWFDISVYSPKKGYFVAIFENITEHKIAEDELKKLNNDLEERVKQRTVQVSAERQRLYNVLETLPSYVVLLDKDHHVKFANKVFRETFGEDHGRPCYEFLFNQNYECENCETYKVYKENKPQHWYWNGPNRRDYDIYDFPFREADGSTLILEMGIDITDQKRAEKLARTAAQYSRSLIEASIDPLVTINPEGKITDVNVATEKATGCSREELIGSDFSEYFTEPEKARAGYMKAFTDGFVKDYPLAIKHKSGRITDVLYNATVYSNEKGKIQGVFAAARDITDLRRIEKVLNKKQEELNRILDSAPTIVFYKDKEGKIIQANKAFADAMKVSKEDLLGKTVFDVFSAKIAQGMANDDKVVFESKRARMNIEEQYESPTGLRWLRTDKIPTFNEKGDVTGLIGFSEDITERKKAEELALESAKKLKVAERLAAIGATAGMVGHDIRNPLQAMTGDVYLLKDELDSLPNCNGCANELKCAGADNKKGILESLISLEGNINYINKIVADLQDYARPIRPEYAFVNVSIVLVKIFDNIKVPDSVKLSIKVKDLKHLNTDSMLLQRALSNLITNAIQAMPDGGTLEITGHPEKNKAVITVSDTGVGIPDDIRPKLFTPMMTTKSKGQGFGLAVSKRLVEALKGTIGFESEIGKGTKFIIELPIRD